MPFEFRQAVRSNVPLLIGLAGGTGSGKTYTALRLARGMAGERKFAFIDTETGRGKHYADHFQFDHGDLAPPFRPDRYLEAILAAEKAGYPVVVVDSMSHEHAGEGGLLDWHEEELERLSKGESGRRDAMTMSAWIKPKMEHKKMVQRLLQLRAHVILCFRAEAKIEIVKDGNKTVVREKQSLVGYNGWIPIAEKNLPYELTVSFMLLADRPGVPHAIKLQQQHKPFFPPDQPITEESGVAIAAWSQGGAIDWTARIAAAKTKRELESIGDQLKLAQGNLQESALAIIRGEYSNRWNELARSRTA